MTIQEAIRRAVEGGWKPFDKFKKKFELEDGYAVLNDGVNIRRRSLSDILLDPLFWQALGKSMGWESIRVHKKYDGLQGGVWGDEEKWLNEWHRLIDHLAEGKSIEEYFRNL